MLEERHFNEMADAIRGGAKKAELKLIANKIRMDLNPHPAGQMSQNVPVIDDVKLTGAQNYFVVTLEQAWRIFRKACQQVSGIARSFFAKDDPYAIWLVG